MAITKSSGVLICMLLLLTLFIQDFAECSSRGEFVYRKLFLELRKMALKKNGVPKLAATNEMIEDSELRRVPTGPDPLHHNGQDPRKPRNP